MLEFEKAGEYEDVIYEKSGYVARITLNKLDTLNSGVKDFGKAFAAASAEDDVKIIIIKRAGEFDTFLYHVHLWDKYQIRG
jgi:1,4-dihydroxy-2-naphthoyl-CoA synthase